MKHYRKTLIFASLATLVPIPLGLLLLDRFPEQMVIHYGLTGQPDNWASPLTAVMTTPLIMLATLWLCAFFTRKDPGNQGRNRKVQTLVFWITPALSILTSLTMYALALGASFPIESAAIVLMGLTFAAIGNYLPKTRKNSTIGIRVPWTFSSEENWNATHRLAGRLWMIGGITMSLCAFAPSSVSVTVMVVVLTVMCVVPIVYSWRFYKKEKAEGKDVSAPLSSGNRKIGKASVIFLVVFTVFILIVLFCGNLHFDFREDYLLIDADLYTDYVIFYDNIEDIQFRNENMEGLRIGGYGSFRLLMGYFKNEEFGTYTRYTYYQPESCIVLTVNGKTVVLSAQTPEKTQALYRQLLEHIPQ